MTSGHPDRGFALVLVIWGLGIIALIASTLTVIERYRVQAATNLVGNAEAEALAEGGIALARLTLAARFQGATDHGMRLTIGGPPTTCRLPSGDDIVVLVEDEGGKVDINAASPGLLTALLRGVRVDGAEADKEASAILAFTRPSTDEVLEDAATRAYATDGRRYGPKKAGFESTLELDQVLGLRPSVLRAIEPFVTVHAHRGEVDPHAAAPALLGALSRRGMRPVDPHGSTDLDAERAELARGVPIEFLGTSTHRSFLIHAEVRTTAGGFASREALVELTAGTPPDVVRELRLHGLWRGRGGGPGDGGLPLRGSAV